MDTKVIFRRLRLEVSRGDVTIMNFSSPNDDEVIMLRDKIVATNTSGRLKVKLYEEMFTERLLSETEHEIVPQLVEDGDISEDIGLW